MSTSDFVPRREWIRRAGCGFGLLGLASLLKDHATTAAGESAIHPLSPRRPHFRRQAKQVIWIFANGGPSQVDTWDHKPALDRWHGKSMRAFDPTLVWTIQSALISPVNA